MDQGLSSESFFLKLALSYKLQRMVKSILCKFFGGYNLKVKKKLTYVKNLVCLEKKSDSIY